MSCETKTILQRMTCCCLSLQGLHRRADLKMAAAITSAITVMLTVSSFIVTSRWYALCSIFHLKLFWLLWCREKWVMIRLWCSHLLPCQLLLWLWELWGTFHMPSTISSAHYQSTKNAIMCQHSAINNARWCVWFIDWNLIQFFSFLLLDCFRFYAFFFRKIKRYKKRL